MAGQSSTLTWSTENADDITLDGNKVDLSGIWTVSPTQTTTYHLTAKGAGGTQDATAQVTVVSPPPIPTPTPAPPSINDEQLFAASMRDVFFDFRSSLIRPDAAEILRQNAELLKSHSALNIRLDGYADGPGTTEYNLDLGERRSLAVRNFLVDWGISADRISQPFCTAPIRKTLNGDLTYSPCSIFSQVLIIGG
jgi:peptidoglycan-associated lipoprotein